MKENDENNKFDDNELDFDTDDTMENTNNQQDELDDFGFDDSTSDNGESGTMDNNVAQESSNKAKVEKPKPVVKAKQQDKPKQTVLEKQKQISKANKKKMGKHKLSKKDTLIRIGIIIAAILVIFIIILVIKNTRKYSLNTVDNEALMSEMYTETSTEVASEATTEASTTEQSTEQSTTVAQADITDAVSSSKLSPVDLNKYAKVKTKVNAKVKGASSYEDIDANINVELTGVTVGYDNVKKAVDAYNESSNTIVNLPAKTEFYSADSSTELAMFTFNVNYPNKYPTDDGSKGKIYTIPTLNIKAYGTTAEINSQDINNGNPEDYIVTNGTIYSIAQFTPLTATMTEADAGQTYQYNWIVSIPVGADASNYAIEMTVGSSSNTVDYAYFKGQSIAESKDMTDTIASASANAASGNEVSDNDSTESTTEASTEQGLEEITEEN